jgi:hypothetical protein
MKARMGTAIKRIRASSNSSNPQKFRKWCETPRTTDKLEKIMSNNFQFDNLEFI